MLNLIPNEKLEFAYTNTETIEAPRRYEYRRNKGGDVLSYEVKGYFSLCFDRWSASVGYTLSTYDPYSGRRNILIEGERLDNHLPAHRSLTHTGFIGVGYAF